MSSRDRILAAVRKNKPTAPAPLPQHPAFDFEQAVLVDAFALAAEAAASKVLRPAPGESLETLIRGQFPEAQRFASTHPSFAGNVELIEGMAPSDLETVDVAVMPGRLGVAENGAVWLPEDGQTPRVLPFITQHLVVVLPADAIVSDMHEAYRRIRVEEAGFGAFIAGPSKTGDIEQALVIGAQAARSFTVVVL